MFSFVTCYGHLHCSNFTTKGRSVIDFLGFPSVAQLCSWGSNRGENQGKVHQRVLQDLIQGCLIMTFVGPSQFCMLLTNIQHPTSNIGDGTFASLSHHFERTLKSTWNTWIFKMCCYWRVSQMVRDLKTEMEMMWHRKSWAHDLNL